MAPRTVDPSLREALLDRITAYIIDHGLSELSLRPLAEALDSSPRALLYHFGSKEALVAAVLARVRARQRALFDRLRRTPFESASQACLAVWEQLTRPSSLPLVRLFFETYALALRDPKGHAEFFVGAVEEWLRFLAEPLIAGGATKAQARTAASVILAGYRGLLLDFAGTGDRARVEAALKMWLPTLDTLVTENGA